MILFTFSCVAWVLFHHIFRYLSHSPCTNNGSDTNFICSAQIAENVHLKQVCLQTALLITQSNVSSDFERYLASV